MTARDSDPALGATVPATPRDDTEKTASAAPRDATITLPVGNRLGDRYVVKSFLGEGGMGAVYRARDEKLDEDVALKVMRGVGISDTLRDEVRLAQKVTHANVCRTYDLEEAGGYAFVKMEFVEGETLAARLERTGKLAIDEAVRIARQLAAGLAAAHAKGIVHRDLKPGNIMLAGDRVVLMDFGIAHVIASPTEGTAGTLGYMAPEQITEGPVDGRADYYALGCVLYEMLAGTPLFADAKRLELAVRHASTRPPDVRAARPLAPRWLAHTVRDLLAKVPERRELGIARLVAGPRSWWRIAGPIAAVVVAAGAIVAWRLARSPEWQAHVVSFKAYEESSDTVSLSPDGAWLVFDSDRKHHGEYALYAMSRATGETFPLSTPPGVSAMSPRWTRDGRALLYVLVLPGGDHIVRQRVAGSPPQTSGEPEDLGTGIAPDACGDDIVYLESSPSKKRVIVLARDGTRTPVAELAYNEALSAPRCDASGQHVVYAGGKTQEWESGNDIFIADRGGHVRQVTTDHVTSTAMFANDGETVLFTARHGDRVELFAIPAAGGTARALGVEASSVEGISRDGKLLVFARNDTTMFPAMSDHNAPSLVSSERGNYIWARPAGPDRIVARRARGNGSDVVTIRIGDGAVTTLVPGYAPFPSRDNRRVYFSDETDRTSLRAIAIDGGAPETIAKLPGTLMFGSDGPDGQHVALETASGVQAYRVAAGKVEPEGVAGLVTVAPSGGWRAVTELFAKTGREARSRLLLVAPGKPLTEPARVVIAGSVINPWLDDHRIGYCGEGGCKVLDAETGQSDDVPAYPELYEHLAIVMPDGKRVLSTLTVDRVTRFAVDNFDGWR